MRPSEGSLSFHTCPHLAWLPWAFRDSVAGKEGTLHVSQPLFSSLWWVWNRVERILSYTP